MTPGETVVLARYVRALCPQQKFDEYTPDAWHDVLGDYSLAAARAAAASVARQKPFVSPAEIIAEIKQQRENQASDFQGPGLAAAVPDADPDDVHAYLAALREQRTRAADGMDLKPRPVAQLISGVIKAMPQIPGQQEQEQELAEVRRPGPLGVECPSCQAAMGRPCRVEVGERRRELRIPHSARTRVAKGGPVHLESPVEIERRRAASAARLAALAEAEASSE